MRLEHLQYLIEVAKTGSLSMTAERIYVAQPTITEAIKKLEEEFGVTLLTRSYRGVSLTEAGEKLVETSKQIFGMLDNLKSEFRLNNEIRPAEIKGNLLIYATPDVTCAILPNVLDIFSKRYPNVNATVYETDIFHVIEGIQAGNADLGIISMVESVMGNDVYNIDFKDIYFEKLFSSKIFAVVGNNSPLASRVSMSLTELMKYPLVFYCTHPVECWINSLKAYGTPNIYLKSSSDEIYANAIIKNQAIGFMPDFYLNDAKRKYNYVPIAINEELTGVVGWLKPSIDDISLTAKEFIKILKDQY